MIERVSLSVDRVVALARHASMSTSYKPALLKALLRIVRASPDLEIPLHVIGAEFLRLYWVQTVVFHLRQAAMLTKEPEVVRAIRDAAATAGVRNLADLSPEARLRLERDMARILRINILEAFHRSAPDSMRPLYYWEPSSDRIRLDIESFHFLRQNGSTLESVANLWWARYLEKVNVLAPRIIQKVERQDARRGSIGKYLRILREVDVPTCFYCDRMLSSVQSVHVDHVIPWSFLLEDPVWDLVLACVACNLAKSDSLPDHRFLVKLTATHHRRAAATLLARGSASPLIVPNDIERLYEAALAVEWPHGWLPAT